MSGAAGTDATRVHWDSISQNACERRVRKPCTARKAPGQARPARDKQLKFLALCGIGTEMLLELTLDALPLIGVGRCLPLAGNVRPGSGILPVELNPALGRLLAVRHDCLDRALGLADAAVDAFLGIDHQHVLALVEAIHGADFDAVHVLALDAGIVDDVGHSSSTR